MTVRANTTVHLPGNQSINAGDLYDDDHDWVRRFPQFFDDIASRVIRPIEQATAAPGETRDTAPIVEPATVTVDDTPTDEDEEPTGFGGASPLSTAAILEIVDGDPVLAQEALAAEQASPAPRKTLVKKLEKILGDTQGD